MKELTIEENVKAIDVVKQMVADGQVSQDVAERYFPELKESEESEDERIRKGLIDFFSEPSRKEYILNGGFTVDDIIAWLEKQGEQKPVKVPKFKVGDFIQFNGMGHYRYTIKDVCGLSHYINSFDRRMDMSYTDANFELVEQKPAYSRKETKPDGGIVWADFNGGDGYYKVNLAYLSKSQVESIENLVASWQNTTNNTAKWSEEDEKCIRLSTDIIDSALRAGFCVQLDRDRCVDWLKFLKDRYTWKPSETQLETLKELSRDVPTKRGIIEELLKQLKQL